MSKEEAIRLVLEAHVAELRAKLVLVPTPGFEPRTVPDGETIFGTFNPQPQAGDDAGEVGLMNTTGNWNSRLPHRGRRMHWEADAHATMLADAIEALARATGTAQEPRRVTDEMVTRFLGWRLPQDFAPDAGISFNPVYNEKSPWGPMRHEPFGTNLLNAEQARAMLEHVLGVAPGGEK